MKESVVILIARTTLLFIVIAQTSAVPIIIYVNGNSGNDSMCQSQGQDTEFTCKSLETAGSLLNEFRSNVRLEVQTNTTLSSTFEVMNSTQIDLVGTADNFDNLTYIRCGPQNTGFLIYQVQNISVLNLVLVNCTARFKEDNHFFAMLVRSSSQIVFKNVRFLNCTTTGLVMINNTGLVTLYNTSFIHNSPLGNRKKSHVPVSHPGALTIQQNLEEGNETFKYEITHSTFHYNQSPQTDNVSVLDTSISKRTSFINRGYGGAVFIEFGGNTANSFVSIEDSNFTYNTAERGGGVYAYYKDNAQNNSISFLRTKFEGNHADISGGGLNLGHINSPSLLNVFTVKKCRFIKNAALIGAGLTVYSVYGGQKLANGTSFLIQESEWYENAATLSSAVDIRPLHREIGDQGYLPTPEFLNCTFEKNTIQTQPKVGKTNHNNVGVFSITQFEVLFSGKTTFKSNSYSAILIESGIVEFASHSEVLFENNKGFNGGAMAVYGFSTLVLNTYLFINFSGNHASNYGGAIFYEASDQRTFLKGNNNCFIRNKLSPSQKNLISTIGVFFEHNEADTGGSGIYSTSFQSCRFRCMGFFGNKISHHNHNRSILNIFRCVGHFVFKDDPHPLTTSGEKFQFLDKNFHHSVFPGSSVFLNFAVRDDFYSKVRTLLKVTKTDPKAQVDVKEDYTLSNEIYPIGKPNSSSQFILTAVGVREIYFPFRLTLLPCPPGYHNINNTCTCASGELGYAPITKCNNSKFNAQYKGDFWVGYIGEHLYFAPCVDPLCDTSNHHLPKWRESLTKLICTEHRQGVMCGRCAENYTTYFHSRNFSCRPVHLCHLGGLLYMVSEIFPMIGFFVIVITFDLSFTSGKLVGFVFFTQYLNQLTIHIDSLFSYLRMPYRIFYGMFNFEFFNIEKLSFCLWTRAQILDVLAVKYVTIAIALGLVLAFIALMQNISCNRLCKLRSKVSTKTSVVHGLSAFLVMCYAQSTRTSFYILRYTTLSGYRGVKGGHYSYYGGLPYFHKQHLIYAIPALISVMFVTILPPLVLLLYPLSLQLLSLCGLSEHWIVNKTLQLTGINKLVPFIDCFQSCYKDKLRFFAGLYFVYRVAILVVFTVSSNSLAFSIYAEVVIVFILGIHATVQPYKERLHNITDSLLFLNLALINGCNIISKQWINLLNDPNSYKSNPWFLLLSSIQLVLLYLPMITVLLLLPVHGFTYVKCRGAMNEATNEVSAIPVNDVLQQDSAEQSNLLASTRSAVSESSSRKTDYGSVMEDTY